tara:strand:- start:3968 stop:4294 length:327 start_codon:yes stop_codon:yes gene_type:complete
MEYGGNKKKIVFYDTDDRHVALKVKLQYHGLTQAAFFRAVVSGLIDDDEYFADFLRSYKESNDIQSKRQRKVVNKEEEAAEKIKNSFSLETDEISNIFDMIEKEHPDL